MGLRSPLSDFSNLPNSKFPKLLEPSGLFGLSGLGLSAIAVLALSMGLAPKAIAQPSPASDPAASLEKAQEDPQPVMIPGLDLQSTVNLWEAIDILSTSLEQGLDIPCRFNGARANERDIQAEGLTSPSLWLPQELIGGKIIRGWYVYAAVPFAEELGSLNPDGGADVDGASLPWVELVINEQPWQKLKYLEQYRALETMGRSAFRFGYRLRACNQRGEMVALYACGAEVESEGGAKEAADDLRKSATPCRALLRGGMSARLNRNPFGF